MWRRGEVVMLVVVVMMAILSAVEAVPKKYHHLRPVRAVVLSEEEVRAEALGDFTNSRSRRQAIEEGDDATNAEGAGELPATPQEQESPPESEQPPEVLKDPQEEGTTAEEPSEAPVSPQENPGPQEDPAQDAEEPAKEVTKEETPETVDAPQEPEVAPLPDAQPEVAPLPDAQPEVAPLPEAQPEVAPPPVTEPESPLVSEESPPGALAEEPKPQDTPPSSSSAEVTEPSPETSEPKPSVDVESPIPPPATPVNPSPPKPTSAAATSSTSSSPTSTPMGSERPTRRPRPQQKEPGELGEDSSSIKQDSLCDFGTGDDIHLCDWSTPNGTQMMWTPSKGASANWIGGPVEDVTYGDDEGGYAVFETSMVPKRQVGLGANFESAMLVSAMRGSTGPKGECAKFWYAIGGLSPDRMRVLLHPLGADADEETIASNMMLNYDGSDDILLWETRDMTMDDWKEGQVVYTFKDKHMIIFEAIPVEVSDLSRQFRGYIAVDEISFVDSSDCGAFCTFEGGFCGWVQDEEDDMQWTLSRGSENPSTGPPRDRSSSSSGTRMGGFAVIDSSYPRRPGDKARLMSQEFRATNPDSPLCMRFWTHMYGNGIGTLSVIIYDVNEGTDRVIWSLSGDAGNAWYQGQVPIASGSPFKIVFEGAVGSNNLGDIAIDDISIVQGACPTAPQVAAPGRSGDCTFEVDECGWANQDPRRRLDEIDWVRTVASDNRAPSKDHTMGTTAGYYMTLPRGSVQRGGDRAWFVSESMQGSSDVKCVSFWYFMFEPFIDTSGPALGSLVVYVAFEDRDGQLQLIPIWKLKNHQGPNWMYGQAKYQSDVDFRVVFEGTWGSTRGDGFIAIDDITFFTGDCSTMPVKAMAMKGDCDFQTSNCRWQNSTTDPDFVWMNAFISRRPASLSDHTFGGPVGYVYFDVFNQNQKPQTLKLQSPVMLKTEDDSPVCFTFWFASFGSEETTFLKVEREPYDRAAAEEDQNGEEEAVQVWSLSAESIDTTRPEWRFGQVEVDASSDFRVILVGEASNGGYAIDDIRTYPGGCKARPEAAVPARTA